MAFKIELTTSLNEWCDICKKIDTTKPMLMISTTGKGYDQRNFIWVHLDEFEKKLAKLKEKNG